MSAPRRSSGARPSPRSRNRPADAPAGARPDRPAGPPGPARAAAKTAKATKPTKAAGQRRRSSLADALPAAPERARRRTERRTQLTGRAAVLALVIVALSLSLAYPIRQYFGQRAEMAQMREQVRQQEQRVAQLQAERDRWSDPAYIRAQARKRLHYCMPDETCFVTVNPAATRAGR
ncbi:MAG TPA: septum formation initiator family protein [Actinomycetes bacterium]|jgi:cell division protein FtsB|nr:septum formation initiator family protein [Actinomycetes bacterium]